MKRKLIKFLFLLILLQTKAAFAQLAVPQLSGFGQSAPQEIVCTIFDKSEGEDGHWIQVSPNPTVGPWTLIKTVPASAGISAFRVTIPVNYPVDVTRTLYFRATSFKSVPLEAPGWSLPERFVFSNRAPAPPIRFGIAALSETSAYMSFRPSSPNQDYYILERADESLVFGIVAQLSTFDLTYQDNGLKHNTFYTYRIKACNEIGCSGWTTATVRTRNGNPRAPSGGGLRSTAPNQMYASWRDNSINETGFVIQRADENLVYQTITTVPANQVFYIDNTVSANTKYFYRVAAINGFGMSAFHNLGEMRTMTGIPNAPTGGGLAPTEPTVMYMSWVDRSTNETGFTIQRADENLVYQTIVTVPANQTFYVDRGLEPGKRYFYRVASVTNFGSSNFHNLGEMRVIYGNPSQVAVKLTDPNSPESTTLTWKDNAPNELSYNVFRTAKDGAEALVGNVPTNTTTYIDNTTVEKTEYSYAIQSVYPGGFTSQKIAISITTPAGIIPNKPTLNGLVDVEKDRIGLSWEDVGFETSYLLEKSYDGTTYTTLATLPANAVNYVDSMLVALQPKNYYRLTAINKYGNNGASNVFEGTMPIPAIAVLTGTTDLDKEIILLSWTDVTNENGYVLERSLDGTNYSKLADLATNTTSYVDSMLSVTESKFFYRISSNNKYGNSGLSNVYEGFIPRSAPAAPALTGTTDIPKETISLTWEDVAYEKGYAIERSFDGVTFEKLADLAENSILFVDSLLPVTQDKYIYRISASNKYGSSEASNLFETTIPRKPALPTELTAMAPSFDKVLLSWKDNSNVETAYHIIKMNSNGETQKFILDPNTVTFVDSSLNELTDYNYAIVGVNGVYVADTVKFATIKTPFKPLAMPTSLAGESVGFSEVKLSWVDNNMHEGGFIIERSIDDSKFDKLVELPANSATYQDKNVSDNATYYYRISTFNANTTSDTTASVKIFVPLRPLNPPTNLVGNSLSDEEISLTWEDKEGIETAYEVERSTDGTTFTRIASLPANSTTYLNGGLTQLTKYFYRVRAINAIQPSAYSNTVEVSTKITTSVIKEKLISEINVYPNPVVDKITIDHPEGTESITISSQLGATVRTAKVTKADRSTSLDISGLNAGMYIVRASGNGNVLVKKIIKN